MEIVINKCYGGFGLSHKAVMKYAELKGLTLYPWIDDISKRAYGDKATLDNPSFGIHYTLVPKEEYDKIIQEEYKESVSIERFKKSNSLYFSERGIARDDPLLIQIVKSLGEEANGKHAELKIVSIPDNIDWKISEYDGMETIEEKHRSWY